MSVPCAIFRRFVQWHNNVLLCLMWVRETKHYRDIGGNNETTEWIRHLTVLPLNILFVIAKDNKVFGIAPSSIYSWSISHILEHEFFYFAVWAAQAVRKKKWIWVFLSNVWGWFFQLFVGKKEFKNIVGSALKSYIA